jgi:chemotaxis protein histidine kinase CheA
MNTNTPVIDMSYLETMAGTDSSYLYEVLNIYLKTVTEGLEKLEKLVRNTDDFDAIYKQAHSLKSSFSVIKVDNIFDDINNINLMARSGTNKEEITERLDRVLVSFNNALPYLHAEMKKNKPK